MQQRERFISLCHEGPKYHAIKMLALLILGLCMNPKQKNIALVVILFHLGLLVYLPIDRVIGGEIQGIFSRRLS